MKTVAAFLLVLCCIAVSQAWRCAEGPRLSRALQIDAGTGKVVARDRNNYVYYLIGSSWYRLSTIRFRHASVGSAGIWAASTSSYVYKYVGGQFRLGRGVSMKQVDAGGDEQIVGVSSSYNRGYCLRNSYARAFSGGTLRWSYQRANIRYYSCSPVSGCWAVDTIYRVWYSRTYPHNCGSTSWSYQPGLKMRMVEVGSDGRVIAVGLNGWLYERRGRGWTRIPMCSTVVHASYDLRTLWAVTRDGAIMRCTV